ncbi:MAG: PrsW family intramembrane metalloprotease [Flavobacteriaceae bacterium]|jgi:RsiW-degrading membrane proteinase PrsW (M82 family)|nr:PrsW family intramembrane metalloprotease [Flavobacteriaceae bacterium]
MTLLIASITPVIIFLYTIFKKDKNKEPLSLVAKCFLGGFASIIITLIIDIPLIPYSESIPSPFFKSFFDAFIVAAIPEELSKYVILYWLVWKSKYFDEYYDGIVYAIFVSLGFAMIENLFYVFEYGMGTAFIRAILAVPGHGFFAVFMGYFMSKARFGTTVSRRSYLMLSLLIPIALHGTYDFLIMYSVNLSEQDTGLIALLLVTFTLFIIYLWRIGIQRIKSSIAQDIPIESQN